MKKIATAVLATSALLWPALTSAQRSTDLTAKQAPSATILAPLCVGTAFNASLTESLDTRRAKPGDAVTAEVVEDVAYERSIIFPKGTKVLGHVVRATSGGRGRAGSALFVQFDRAVLTGGEEVLLNAGIQALGVISLPALPDTDVSKRAAALARNDSKLSESSAQSAQPVSDSAPSAAPLIVSTDYNRPRTSVAAPLSLAPKAQGELNSDGLFSPDSVGAFGRPDLKLYTPTSQGSHGTVLLSAKKQMRLESGTRLLLVVQPPTSPEPDARGNADLSALPPKP